MRLKAFICLLLGGITLAIYWPVRHYPMIDLDDPVFLHPEAGTLSWHGLERAMTDVVVANWHPITNLSFLLMHQFYGLNPGAEHLVNALFHAANAVLLFWVLARMISTSPLPLSPHPLPSDGIGADGARHDKSQGNDGLSRLEPTAMEPGKVIWLCAIVAGVFAWHPLRVESVAWISERKDVLYVFFMLLSLLCYTEYVQGRTKGGWAIGSGTDDATRRPCHWWNGYYFLALVFFVFSFLSKATVVTFPFLLLLLDYWPLGRFRDPVGFPSPHPDPLRSHQTGAETEQQSNERHIRHKTRRATAICLVIEKIPFFALTVVFCALTFWVHKTHSDIRPLEEFGAGARIENSILSYINYLGKFFWPTNLALPYPFPRSFDPVQVVLSMLLLLAISAECVWQLRRRPYLAAGWFWYLGTMVPVIGLVQVGDQAMADRHTYIPLIGPSVSLAWLIGEWVTNNTMRKYLAIPAAIALLLACVILSRKQIAYWENPSRLFSRTIAVTPDNFVAQSCLATALEYEGRFREAAVHYRVAIALKPRDYQMHYQLAVCLSMAGKREEALTEYQTVVAEGYNTNDYVAAMNYADALMQIGRNGEAVVPLESALRLDPDSTIALGNLAWILATYSDASVRDGVRAVQLAERACELTNYKQTQFIGTLAAAYAEAGRFDEAVAMAQKAIANAQKQGEAGLAEKNRGLLQLYLAHKAYHD
jgi:tetratricopeptide (TPR) repeat protein